MCDALYDAAKSGDASRVRGLLARHMPTNETTREGKTAVMAAAMCTHTTEPLQLLLEVGVQVNMRDKRGWTALHHACAYGTYESTEMLLNAGADVNQRDNDGFEPIHSAAQFNDAKVLNLLIECGANVEARAKLHETPLIVAAGKKPVNIMVLITSGADINSQTKWNSTALHWASKLGCHESVAVLLGHSAEVDVRNKHGDTPLHLGCAIGNPSTLFHLLQAGADVNALNLANKNPLYVSCENNNLDAVRILLDHGADPDVQDNNGNAALHVATSQKNMSIVDALLGTANVNTTNKHGRTPLMVAAEVGSVVARLLIGHDNAMPDHVDFEGNSAIHLACMNGHVVVGQVLTNHRVKLDVPNKAGQIPVVAAADARHGQMTRMMIHRTALQCPKVTASLNKAITLDKQLLNENTGQVDVSHMIKDWFDGDIVDMVLKFKDVL